MTPDDSHQRDLERLRHKVRSPEEYAALTEAVADRKRQPGYLVVLARQPELPSPENVAAFAKAMDLDPFTARQRLILPTARFLLRADNEERAKQSVQWLRSLSLRAFAVGEEELAAQRFHPQAAVYMDAKQIVCDDTQDQRQTIPVDKICALVFGEVIEKTFSESAGQGMLTENLGYRRENLSLRTEAIIDIHRRDSPVTLRIAQDSFRFSRLFPGRQGASAVLIRELYQRLRNALPNAKVFEEFNRVEDVLGISRNLVASSTYLSLNWLKPGLRSRVERQDTSVDSNAETFDIYSTLARLEILRAE